MHTHGEVHIWVFWLTGSSHCGIVTDYVGVVILVQRTRRRAVPRSPGSTSVWGNHVSTYRRVRRALDVCAVAAALALVASVLPVGPTVKTAAAASKMTLEPQF